MTTTLSLKTLAALVLDGRHQAEREGGTPRNRAHAHTTPLFLSSVPPIPAACSAFQDPGGGTPEHRNSITAEDLLAPDLRPCWICGRLDVWTDRYSVRHCRICHPPAPGAEVREFTRPKVELRPRDPEV